MVRESDRRRSHLAAATSVLLCAFLVVGRGEVPADAADMPPAVVSLLKAQCVKCHGPIKRKAGLDLSTPTGLARGGEGGAAVVGGALDQSLLWQRVDAGEMPPAGPLSAAEKSVLRMWISDGAGR